MSDFLSTSRIVLQRSLKLFSPSVLTQPCAHLLETNFKGQQTTMARSTMRNPLPLTLLTSALVVQVAHSQVGTITQDIFTLSAFPLQKPCAQSCFVVTEF